MRSTPDGGHVKPPRPLSEKERAILQRQALRLLKAGLEIVLAVLLPPEARKPRGRR